MKCMLSLIFAIAPLCAADIDHLAEFRKKYWGYKDSNDFRAEYQKKWSRISQQELTEPEKILADQINADCPQSEKRDDYATGRAAKQANFAQQSTQNYGFLVLHRRYALNCKPQTNIVIPKKYDDSGPSGIIDRFKSYWWPTWWREQSIKKENQFWYHKYAIEMTEYEIKQRIFYIEKNSSDEDLRMTSDKPSSIELNDLQSDFQKVKYLQKDFLREATDLNTKEKVYLYKEDPQKFFNNWLQSEQTKKNKLACSKKRGFFTPEFFMASYSIYNFYLLF